MAIICYLTNSCFVIINITKLGFLFVNFIFGMKVKGQRNPNSQGGAGKPS